MSRTKGARNAKDLTPGLRPREGVRLRRGDPASVE